MEIVLRDARTLAYAWGIDPAKKRWAIAICNHEPGDARIGKLCQSFVESVRVKEPAVDRAAHPHPPRD